MTITLNDVAALTHLKIDGVFMTPPRLTSVQAPPVLVQYLGMSPAEAHDEVVQQKGPSISFDKLKKICDARRVMDDQESRIIVGRAYLLLVIGWMVLPDKSWTAVPIAYLTYLVDLRRVSRFAWGAILLAHLYDQLSKARLHKC